MKPLAIVGGGSWGTALAITLASRFSEVRLWVHDPQQAEKLAQARENVAYLPGFPLPEQVRVSQSFAGLTDGCDFVLGVVPSAHARGVYRALLPFLQPGQVLVSATKGLEAGTLLRMSQVIADVAGPRSDLRVTVLSGPNFAREVARQDPTVTVIASTDRAAADQVQSAFATPSFRLYTNADVIGVEVGAALKNVIAIGAGVCEGLGLGGNATAALITRGLAEITRLAVAMGGQSRTLAGLAGLGDLVLTCTGELSRNRRVGMELARGRTLQEIIDSTPMVAEGIPSTFAGVTLGEHYGVELPITRQMQALLQGRQSPREAIRQLMERSLKEE